MALSQITREEVLRAVAEYRTLGRPRFLERYGFGEARRYFLEYEGERFDSKAIVGAAHRFLPSGRALTNSDFSGGEQRVARLLRRLAFTVHVADDVAIGLVPGQIYAWRELGERFGFAPSYLGAAGGMISRPGHDALLIITHPEGAKSFDYADYWDEGDLIYAGRGKVGDQKFAGQNRDLAEATHIVLTFEPAGSRQLRFIGSPRCVEHWWTREADQRGQLRRVLRFRLRFDGGRAPRSEDTANALFRPPRRPTARPFDPDALPPAAPRPGQRSQTPEATAQLLEQANRGHHALIKALAIELTARGWKEIEDMPGGFDLSARKRERRLFSEAKTLRDTNEAHQVRLAIAQLFEYRFVYGRPEDCLCLIVDAPIAAQRVHFLDSLGIGVLINDLEGLRAVGVIVPTWI